MPYFIYPQPVKNSPKKITPLKDYVIDYVINYVDNIIVADRKSTQKNTRSLTKVAGKSFGITLPIDLIRALGWKPKQKLTVTPKGKKLIVKDWKQ